MVKQLNAPNQLNQPSCWGSTGLEEAAVEENFQELSDPLNDASGAWLNLQFTSHTPMNSVTTAGFSAIDRPEECAMALAS